LSPCIPAIGKKFLPLGADWLPVYPVGGAVIIAAYFNIVSA
jgi:hypothetical protein